MVVDNFIEVEFFFGALGISDMRKSHCTGDIVNTHPVPVTYTSYNTVRVTYVCNNYPWSEDSFRLLEHF